VRFPFAAG